MSDFTDARRVLENDIDWFYENERIFNDGYYDLDKIKISFRPYYHDFDYSFISDYNSKFINLYNNLIDKIIASYKQARESKLAEIRSGCTDSVARDRCVATVCANNMRDKCQKDVEKDKKFQEKPMAVSLCSFYETACRTIK